MEKKSTKKLSTKEIVWYSIAAFFALAGLVFLVVGIVGEHLPMLASENGILISEKAWLTSWSPLGYRYWGIILVGAAALLAVICLTFFAREGDRDSERALRRAQRLGIAKEEATEVPSEPKAE